MFWLEPRPASEQPQRGSPRMFRVRWMEKYLSRVRPWQVVVVWAPVTAFFLAGAARDPRLGPGRAAAGMLLGLVFWTLLEYALHRWVFHFDPNPASEFQRDLSFLVHGVHHDWPHDADRLVMPPVAAVAIALAVGLPMRAVLGAAWFAPAFAGLLVGYLWYDLTHYAVHHLRPRTALGRMQRRHHLLHHFRDSSRLYGVTTPLWDLVLGTWPREAPEAGFGRGAVGAGRAGAPPPSRA